MTATAPRRRWIRRVVLALVLLLLLPFGAVAVFALTFDANAWKPRIEAAVQAATGRGFAIAGPIGTKLSLRPTVTLAGVTLANPPGYSRPAMASIRRAEVQVALLPLLARRVELARLELDGVDLLLERDARGVPNWVLGRPAAPPQPAPPAPEAGAPASRPFGIAVDAVLLTDSRVALKEGPAVEPRAVLVQRLALDAVGAARRLRLQGGFTVEERALTLAGEAGPLAALLAGDPAPWPLRLDLAAEGGLALRVEGALTPPLGYRLALEARADDLAALAPLLPDQPLPPLRAVAASAVVTGSAGVPAVSDLRLAIGQSDLGVLRPGLVLERATLALPAIDQPLVVAATARFGDVPLVLAARSGAPARLLLAGAAAPWPVELSLGAAAAKLSLVGTLADPRGLRGLDLALAAEAPDLAVLAPLLPGVTLPPLRDLVVRGQLALPGPGLEGGATLRGLGVTASAGDLAGDLAWTARPRQAVRGQLAATRLDLDALRGAGPAARPAQGSPTQGAPAQAAPAQVTPPGAATPERRLIPDIALPLDLPRMLDGDIRLTAQALRAGGADWQAVEAHAVMQAGRGRLDPVAATLAGAGRVTLRAAADVATEPPTVQVALRTEGLELGGIPAAGGATGRLGLDADLRGQGRSLRAVAATAFGRLGLTLEGGRLPPGLLHGVLAGLRQRVPGLDEIAARPLDLSCVAARFEAEQGIATGRVLLAETSLGRIGAEAPGVISLRDERLALRLNADLRLPVPGLPNGLRIRAPLPVAGTLAQPRPEWNAAAGAALQGEVGDRLGRALGGQAGQLLGALGGAIAGQAEAGQGPIPGCAEALALARGQPVASSPPAAVPAQPVPGPAAVPQATPPGPAPRDPVQDLMRRVPLERLFGR